MLQANPLQHAPKHGLGLHVVPEPLNVFGGTHPLAAVIAQFPVVGPQHAPARAVHAAEGQVVLSPWYAPPFADVHISRVCKAQTDPWPQHAPRQGFGLHVVPEPLNTFGGVHPLGAVNAQVPEVGPQHAPARAVHAAAGQVVPSPWYIPLLLQALGERTLQMDPKLQHAPAQTFGLHVVPAPLKRKVQVVETVMLQSPEAPAQHAPASASQAAEGQVVPSP